MSNPENLDNPAAPDADADSGVTIGDDSKLIDPNGALAHAQGAQRDAAEAEGDGEEQDGDQK